MFYFLSFKPMKTLNLNEKSFQLENDVFKFLNDYVERINAFVAKNQIDPDLHQDILQRLADKLTEKATEKNWITQKIAIQIVNDLGEAEEIFAEESDFETLWKSEAKKEKAEPFYKKLQNNQRSRPQETAILLGIFGMFAQVSGRKVRVWRGLVIFANRVLLEGGMGELFFLGRMTYFLLALLFPRKEKDYGERSVLNYFLTQIRDLRLIISNSIKFWFRSVKRIFATAIPTVLKRGAKLFWPLWTMVKICFLLLRSAFLIFVLRGLGILLYYLRTWYVWNNMEMTSLFPAITSWGVALGFLSALLLLLGSIGAIFKKKLMNTVSLTIAIVAWILAMIIAGITGLQFSSNFAVSKAKTYTKEMQILIPDKNQPLIIKVEPNNFTLPVQPFEDIIEESIVINYIPYEWNSIKADFIYQIYTDNKETFAKITENISDPIYEIKDGMLHISHKDHQLFDAVVPLAVMRYSVDLYIPTDWKFNIANYLYANNLRKPERANKRGYSDPYYDQDTGRCSDWITYDEKENVFFCPMEFNIGSTNVRSVIDKDIRNNKADQLSPLVGLNHEWSITWKEGLYWKLDSILWKNNQKFIVKLSDKMFNIFLEVEATVNENGDIIYTKNTVKEIEQKGMMTAERMKLYEGREQLENFKPQIQEEKPDLEERIWTLEAELTKLKGDQ